MKKFILISCAVLATYSAVVSFVNNNDSDRIEQENIFSVDVEALTFDESDVSGPRFYCRCHNDDVCYGGNAISFRRNCYDEPAHSGQVVICSTYSGFKCENPD